MRSLRLTYSIFAYSRDLQWNEGAPVADDGIWNISGVCRRWRAVALAHSDLWAQFDLNWPQKRIQSWVALSQSRPLNIKACIRLSSMAVRFTHVRYPSFSEKKHALSLHTNLLHKVDHLTITVYASAPNAEHQFNQLFAIPQGATLPNLRSIDIRHYEQEVDDDEEIFQAYLPLALIPPTLRSLSLSSLRFHAAPFPLLTELTLCQTILDVKTWASVFESCQSLERLSLVAVDVQGPGAKWRHSRMQVVLPCLKVLKLEHPAKPLCDFFANFGQLPILSSLDVSWNSALDDSKNIIRKVPKLESLKFDSHHCDYTHVLDALVDHALLQDLELRLRYGDTAFEDDLKRYIMHKLSQPHNPLLGGKALRKMRVVLDNVDPPRSKWERWVKERVHSLEIDEMMYTYSGDS